MKDNKLKEGIVKFFRPTKWKVISTIALMIVFLFILLLGVESIKIMFVLPLFASLPFDIESGGWFDTVIIPTVPSLFAALFAYVIQTYLIVCLINWIITKIKGSGL